MAGKTVEWIPRLEPGTPNGPFRAGVRRSTRPRRSLAPPPPVDISAAPRYN